MLGFSWYAESASRLHQGETLKATKPEFLGWYLLSRGQRFAFCGLRRVRE